MSTLNTLATSALWTSAQLLISLAISLQTYATVGQRSWVPLADRRFPAAVRRSANHTSPNELPNHSGLEPLSLGLSILTPRTPHASGVVGSNLLHATLNPALK